MFPNVPTRDPSRDSVPTSPVTTTTPLESPFAQETTWSSPEPATPNQNNLSRLNNAPVDEAIAMIAEFFRLNVRTDVERRVRERLQQMPSESSSGPTESIITNVTTHGQVSQGSELGHSQFDINSFDQHPHNSSPPILASRFTDHGLPQMEQTTSNLFGSSARFLADHRFI